MLGREGGADVRPQGASVVLRRGGADVRPQGASVVLRRGAADVRPQGASVVIIFDRIINIPIGISMIPVCGIPCKVC